MKRFDKDHLVVEIQMNPNAQIKAIRGEQFTYFMSINTDSIEQIRYLNVILSHH